MMRETCICETPTCSPISACVRSSAKRRRRTSRSRGVMPAHEAVDGGAVLGAANPRSSMPMRHPGSRRCPHRRPTGACSDVGPVGAGGFERLEHVLPPAPTFARSRRPSAAAAARWSSSSDRPVDLQRELLQVARDAHRPRPVAEVALDLAEDGRHGVAREGDLALEVEALDGVDEAQAGDLEEVVEGLVGALVAARELAGERQEALDERVAVDRVALVEVAREQRAILRDPRGIVGGVAGLDRTWAPCLRTGARTRACLFDQARRCPESSVTTYRLHPRGQRSRASASPYDRPPMIAAVPPSLRDGWRPRSRRPRRPARARAGRRGRR